MRIAITGSNGFIGNELVKHLVANGHEVLMLQRKPPAPLPTGVQYQQFDLNHPDSLPDLLQVDALVHTAYIPFTASSEASEKNIKGTLALYNLCLSTGVQFVFLSSMSAHANALSQYGKHKFELEKHLAPDKCLVLRLGLVIGNNGLFSRMYKSFKKMPFAVLAGGGMQPVQPVYIGDVVKVIAQCIADKRTGVYTIAANRVYTIKNLFSAIAVRAGKKPIFIPVPYWVLGAAISTIEILHLPFPVSNENLLGLRQLQSADTSGDLKKLGVTLLDLEQSISALQL